MLNYSLNRQKFCLNVDFQHKNIKMLKIAINLNGEMTGGGDIRARFQPGQLNPCCWTGFTSEGVVFAQKNLRARFCADAASSEETIVEDAVVDTIAVSTQIWRPVCAMDSRAGFEFISEPNETVGDKEHYSREGDEYDIRGKWTHRWGDSQRWFWESENYSKGSLGATKTAIRNRFSSCSPIYNRAKGLQTRVGSNIRKELTANLYGATGYRARPSSPRSSSNELATMSCFRKLMNRPAVIAHTHLSYKIFTTFWYPHPYKYRGWFGIGFKTELVMRYRLSSFYRNIISYYTEGKTNYIR